MVCVCINFADLTFALNIIQIVWIGVNLLLYFMKLLGRIRFAVMPSHENRFRASSLFCLAVNCAYKIHKIKCGPICFTLHLYLHSESAAEKILDSVKSQKDGIVRYHLYEF